MSDNLGKNIGKKIGDAIDDAIGDLRGGGGSPLTGFAFEGPPSKAKTPLILKVTHDNNTTTEQSTTTDNSGNATMSLNANMTSSCIQAEVCLDGTWLPNTMTSPWYGSAKCQSDGTMAAWSEAR